MRMIWVHFSVAPNSVGVHDVLKPLGELVGADESWGCFFCWDRVHKRGDRSTALSRAVLECPAQVVQVGLGTPDLSDEALVGHVEAAHVQHVVNGLHLLHLDDVAVDGLGGFTQHLP